MGQDALSKKDRLILHNQLRIIEKLYPEDAERCEEGRKILEGGYRLHYSDLWEWFSDELSEEDSREVLEILDMYRSLTFAYHRLAEMGELPARVTEEAVHFIGFDGNSEVDQLAYARFFVSDLDRFPELVKPHGGHVPNSHIPMLGRYRAMLARFLPHREERHISPDALLQVLDLRY